LKGDAREYQDTNELQSFSKALPTNAFEKEPCFNRASLTGGSQVIQLMGFVLFQKH
jgi:hypothetical protein